MTTLKERAEVQDREIALEKVKQSDCGCGQCLWAGIECKEGKRFLPRWSEVFNQQSCENYTYYD